VLFFAALPLFGAVSGTVMNQTTGKPQPKANVTLFKVGGGMQPLKTVQSDAEGKFNVDLTPQGPSLVQVAWDGVTYNTMVPPGTPSTGLTLNVFDVTKQPSTAKITQHMVLLEPSDSALQVSESLFAVNESKTTYSDPANGSFRFYLPAAANGDVSVTINEPQAIIPLQRPAEKTSTANVYKVNFPIKPGETRFDVSYRLPKTETFSSRILHKEGATRMVAPVGVTLTGDGITPLGTEPRTKATIYEVKPPDYKVSIAGTGSLRPAADSGTSGDDSDDPSGGGNSISQIQAPLNEKRWVIVSLGLAILMLGLIVLYRTSTSSLSAKRAAKK
jgi:hypothetical protein